MKVTTLSFIHRGKEEIKFSYDVNVSKDGKFSTTLPKEAVSKIEAYGVTLGVNRVGNRGYFSSGTMEGLADEVRKVVEEAVSCELVSKEDIIKYQILIFASYCRNGADETDNKLYPNGIDLFGYYKWINGNKNDAYLDRAPTSISIYVEPVTIKRYRYKSGKERIEETRIDENKYPVGSAVLFINSLVGICPDEYKPIKELPCTEENAEFFKKAIMSIWKINESIGKILKEDTLEFAIKKQNLLAYNVRD